MWKEKIVVLWEFIGCLWYLLLIVWVVFLIRVMLWCLVIVCRFLRFRVELV